MNCMALKLDLERLAARGVVAPGAGDPVAMAAAAATLEQGGTIPAEFDRVDLRLTINGGQVEPSAQEVRDNRTLRLNAHDVEVASDVVTGQTSALDEEERGAVEAVVRLSALGASFALTSEGVYLDPTTDGINLLIGQRTVCIPNDASGAAFVLLELERVGAGGKDEQGRALTLVSKGASYPITSIAQLVETANHV